jgi:hypothetical protein
LRVLAISPEDEAPEIINNRKNEDDETYQDRAAEQHRYSDSRDELGERVSRSLWPRVANVLVLQRVAEDDERLLTIVEGLVSGCLNSQTVGTVADQESSPRVRSNKLPVE